MSLSSIAIHLLNDLFNEGNLIGIACGVDGPSQWIGGDSDRAIFCGISVLGNLKQRSSDDQYFIGRRQFETERVQLVALDELSRSRVASTSRIVRSVSPGVRSHDLFGFGHHDEGPHGGEEGGDLLFRDFCVCLF